MDICGWSGGAIWGVPRGFARRSLGVGYDIRSMLREEPFLRWLFSWRRQRDDCGGGRVRLPPSKEGLGRFVAVFRGNSKRVTEAEDFS